MLKLFEMVARDASSMYARAPALLNQTCNSIHIAVQRAGDKQCATFAVTQGIKLNVGGPLLQATPECLEPRPHLLHGDVCYIAALVHVWPFVSGCSCGVLIRFDGNVCSWQDVQQLKRSWKAANFPRTFR